MQLRESSKLITWIYFSHYVVLVFSISQSLPPRFAFFACLPFNCSSLLCVDLEAFSLDVESLFDLSLLNVLQSRKQPMSFLLWSLIVLHRIKQHELNVVGVRNLPDFRCTSNHYVHYFYSHWWWYASNHHMHGPRLDKRDRLKPVGSGYENLIHDVPFFMK